MDITLQNALLFLQGPGVNAAAGVVLSFVVEYIPRFCRLAPRYKRLATGGICLIIPLLSCLAAVLLGYQVNSLSLTWWPAFLAGAIAFGGATVAHVRKLDSAPIA